MLQVSILSECIIKRKVGKKEITLTQKIDAGKKKKWKTCLALQKERRSTSKSAQVN